ncbi:MAG: hypothetical protein AAF065_15390 [Verrucomicrobiota bacterium]
MASTKLDRPFYKLTERIDSMGIYPQNQNLGGNYDYESSRSVHKLKSGTLPSFEPDFGTIIIEKGTTLTDIVSSAPIPNSGILLSLRTKAILDRFRLPPHRYFPVLLSQAGKKVEGYYWLQISEPKDALDAVDFANSKFQLQSSIPNKSHCNLEIETIEEFHKELASLSKYAEKYSIELGAYIACTSYRMNEVFLDRYDLFRINRFDLEFNIRKAVRAAFEEVGITGIEFKIPSRLKMNPQQVGGGNG